MLDMAENYLKISLDYKLEYENTPWWKFKKRRRLKRNWYSCRELMVKHGIKNLEKYNDKYR